MNESSAHMKPIDESGIKPTLILTHIRIHEAFREPNKHILTLLNAFIYLQCLKYPFDDHSHLWFGRQIRIFSYFNIASFTQSLPILLSSILGLLVFVVCFLTIYSKTSRNKVVLSVAKFIQILVGSILYCYFAADLCKFIKPADNQKFTALDKLLAILSMVLLNVALLWQIFIRFDFT